MNTQDFQAQLDSCISKYDLLCHPFYKAWADGKLTKDDLREYAQDYYHHVASFPTYLAEFGIRLEDGELRQAVLTNMCDEKGADDVFGEPGTPHSDLWLDFVEGMGGSRNTRLSDPGREIRDLVDWFHNVARTGTPEEVLAAVYAYESQVPRIAAEKARGLRDMYGSDEKTRQYFEVHTTADVYHSQVWREQLMNCVAANPEAADRALKSAESAAKALWHALDGIEARRTAAAA